MRKGRGEENRIESKKPKHAVIISIKPIFWPPVCGE